MQSHTFVRRPLAWAALAGLLSVASVAQAQSAINASLSVNRVSWQLIDLDPNDGVESSITFTSPEGFSVYANADGVSRFVPNADFAGAGFPCCNTYPANQVGSANIESTGPLSSPFGNSTQSVTSLDNTVTGTLSTDGVSLSARLTEQDLLTLREPVLPGVNAENLVTGKDWVVSAGGGGGYGYGGSSRLSPIFGADWIPTGYEFNPGAVPTWSPYFTVSANTAVVFSGELAATASRDPSSLGEIDPLTTSFAAGGYVFFQVSRYLPKDGQTSWLTLEEAQNVLETDTAYLDFALPDDVLSASDQRAFSLRFTNTSSESVKGLVDMYVSLGAGAAGLAPIPEPSTHALMGLGLVGLAAASRRRQTRAL
jgi:hypothetical protein